jgi:hypothetical protein
MPQPTEHQVNCSLDTVHKHISTCSPQIQREKLISKQPRKPVMMFMCDHVGSLLVNLWLFETGALDVRNSGRRFTYCWTRSGLWWTHHIDHVKHVADCEMSHTILNPLDTSIAPSGSDNTFIRFVTSLTSTWQCKMISYSRMQKPWQVNTWFPFLSCVEDVYSGPLRYTQGHWTGWGKINLADFKWVLKAPRIIKNKDYNEAQSNHKRACLQ